MHVLFWSIGEKSDLVGAATEAILSMFVVSEDVCWCQRKKEENGYIKGKVGEV